MDNNTNLLSGFEQESSETKQTVDESQPDGGNPEGGEGSSGEPTQEELDWRESLKGDELKKNKSLLKFKTVDNLAKSYLEAEKKLGHFTNISHLTKSTNPEKVGEALKKVLALDEKEYKNAETAGEETVKEALNLGISPKALTRVLEKHQSFLEKKAQSESSETLAKWKDEFIGKRDVSEVEKDIIAGLRVLGMTDEEFRDVFREHALNPKMLSFVEKKGKEARDEDLAKIRENRVTGGLPSSEEELLIMFDELSIAEATARNKGKMAEALEAQDKLNKVAAKLSSIKVAQKSRVF